MKLSAGKHLAPKWAPPRTQGPPSAKQVYAFAFHTYVEGITDAEWAEEIKLAIARGHFDATRADTITLAIRMVSKRVGRKDAGIVRPPVPDAEPRTPYLSNADAKRILATIEERYIARRKQA